MPDPSPSSNAAREALPRLRDLLRRRLALIADHELREKDPAVQLDGLRRVSEEIAAFHRENQPLLPARLNHFLESGSFQKALEFVEAAGG